MKKKKTKVKTLAKRIGIKKEALNLKERKEGLMEDLKQGNGKENDIILLECQKYKKYFKKK